MLKHWNNLLTLYFICKNNNKYMRTREERNEMVTILEKQKEIAPRFNYFNDDNHAQLDAQIEVIEEELETDEVDERWNPDDDYNMNSAATRAAEWLDGDDDTGEELKTQWS